MYPGLELLFGTVNLKSKNDAVVTFVHWTLLQNGFLCLGIGDSAAADDTASELLPKNWNNDPEMYTLRYTKDSGENLLVKIIPFDGNLLINVTNLTKNLSAATSVVSDEIVDDITTYHKAFKNIEKLNEIQNKIVSDAFPKPKRSVREEAAAIPNQEREPLRETAPGFVPIRLDPRNVDPIAVGRGDLMPAGLGFDEGGMLMDPRSLRDRFSNYGPHGPHRGIVPPGARFDPFGPPVPDSNLRSNRRFGEPNPDHLPPPGFDDMFG
ncbi:Proteasome inhibitor PI31 subunit [Chamberlinius hualienensis]